MAAGGWQHNAREGRLFENVAIIQQSRFWRFIWLLSTIDALLFQFESNRQSAFKEDPCAVARKASGWLG